MNLEKKRILKLQELISEFSKFTGYMVSYIFYKLATDKWKTNILKIAFIILSKTKYLRILFINYMQDFSENYDKALFKYSRT